MTQDKAGSPADKKILENPFVGSLVVPIAIVLVGVVIIFGVTKMLSTDRSHKDLIREMKSKTFGNRWIAAYELSKLISSSQIDKKDVPELIINLKEIYASTQDVRTRDFIVVALGALRDPSTATFFTDALKEKDPNITFHALVAIGDLPKGTFVSWEKVTPFLTHEDHALRQVAALIVGIHKVEVGRKALVGLLDDSQRSVRFAAATALITFKDESARDTLHEIMTLGVDATFKITDVEGLKLNVLMALERENWGILNSKLEKYAQGEKSPRVESKLRFMLNKLKK
jgi:HEAT repeat protein